LKKTTKSKSNTSSTALDILKSHDFFSRLQGKLRSLGLAGWEIPLGVTTYFATVSRYQSYPLRIHIEERTKGTANYIVQSIAPILPPEDLIIMDPTDEQAWTRLEQSPNDKVLYVPQMIWETETEPFTIDVEDDRIIRQIPREEDGRVI